MKAKTLDEASKEYFSTDAAYAEHTRRVLAAEHKIDCDLCGYPVRPQVEFEAGWHARDAEVRALVEAGRHFENLAFLFSLFGNGRTQEEHDAFVGMEDFKKHKATLAQYAEGGKDG